VKTECHILYSHICYPCYCQIFYSPPSHLGSIVLQQFISLICREDTVNIQQVIPPFSSWLTCSCCITFCFSEAQFYTICIAYCTKEVVYLCTSLPTNQPKGHIMFSIFLLLHMFSVIDISIPAIVKMMFQIIPNIEQYLCNNCSNIKLNSVLQVIHSLSQN
jgi:hypothetical protein